MEDGRRGDQTIRRLLAAVHATSRSRTLDSVGGSVVLSQERSILLAIFCVALFHGLIYVFLVPPWGHYDEPAHFEYGWWIANRLRLPQERDVDRGMRREVAASMLEHGFYRDLDVRPDLLPQPDPIPLGVSEFDHPPAYYALIALPLRVLRHTDVALQLYLGRSVSLLLYLASIGIAYGLLQEWVPPGHSMRWAVPAAMALLPGYVDLMTAVNNDAGAVVALSFFLWGAVRAIVRGPTPCARGLDSRVRGLVRCDQEHGRSGHPPGAAGPCPGRAAPCPAALGGGAAPWRRCAGGGACAWRGRRRTVDPFYPTTGADQPARGASARRRACIGPGLYSRPWRARWHRAGRGALSTLAARRRTGAAGAYRHLERLHLGLAARLGRRPGAVRRRAARRAQGRGGRDARSARSHGHGCARCPAGPGDRAPDAQLGRGRSARVGIDRPHPFDAAAWTVFYDQVTLVEESGLGPNRVRNGSAERTWPRIRPIVDEWVKRYTRRSPSQFLASLLDGRRTAHIYKLAATNLFQSFWARFGWNQIELASGWYWAAGALTLSSGIGALIGWTRLPRLAARAQRVVGLLLAAALLVWLNALLRVHPVGVYTVIPAARYAYPAVIPSLLALVAGWQGLVPRRHRGWWTGLMLALLLVLDVASIWTLNAFYYRR